MSRTTDDLPAQREYHGRKGKGMVKTSSLGEVDVNRPHDTELIVQERLAQWAFRAIVRAVATYATYVGLAILLGGTDRFGGISYQVALQTPGAPWSWGTGILIGGLLLLVGSVFGRVRLVALGGFVGAVWALLFASAFALASVRIPQANTTAAPAYVLLAVVFMVITGVHYAMNPIKLKGRIREWSARSRHRDIH